MKIIAKRLSALVLTGLIAVTVIACSSSDSADTATTEAITADTTESGAEETSSEEAETTASATTSGDTIKVGALFNITGGQASLDEPSFRGFELYFDQLNESGGINGHQIEVVSYDGRTDQTTCATNTSRLIDVDGVVAIGGLSDSNYAFSAGNVAQEAGVPFVFSGATTPSLNDIGDEVFLTPFGDDVQAYAAADFVTDVLGLSKAYILVDQSMEFTTTLASCFQERLEANGGEVVLEDNYMTGDPDFSAQIDRYLNDNGGAEVLFLASTPDDIGTITKQYRDSGVDETMISGDGADTPLLMEVAGDAAEGFYIATHCSFENEDPVVQEFVTLYTDTQGLAPENAFAALGYDCAHVIATAIEACGDDVTPANVRDNLEQIQDLRCVTGVISYSAESHVPQKSVTINTVEDGEFTFVQEVNP